MKIFRHTKIIPLLFITLCASLLFSSASVKSEGDVTFTDVPETHENFNAVKLLSSLGVVKGYSDGTFKPENPINRAEALKILLEGAKVAIQNATDSTPIFRDLATSEWYYKYIKSAKDLGIVNGNPDGTFAPGKQVNKVEFLKMMLLTNKIDISAYQSGNLPFIDTQEGAWYLAYIRYAKQFNIISPDENGNSYPSKNLTRGEAAEILYRLILIIRGGEVQQLLSESESLLVDALIDVQNKKYTEAQLKVFKAVEKTKLATTKSDKAIVQAAHLVSQSLEKTIKAYLYALEGKTEDAKKEAVQAINFSNEADLKSASVTPITTQIRDFANKIKNQLEQTQP